MKAIHVISDTNFGGAGRYLLTLLDYFPDKKTEFEVIVPINSMLKPELDKREILCTEARYLNESSLDIRAISTLLRLFKEKKPDIVHTHAALSGRIAARLYGKCKIIHTRHSVFDPPRWLTIFPFRQLYGSINNLFSHKIIAVSPAAKKNLTDTGTDPRRVIVIYNGEAQLERKTPQERISIRQGYGIGETDFVVSVIARLEAIKGQAYAINAAKKLASHKDIKIVLAGTGSQEQALRKRASSLPNLLMPGFIQDIEGILNCTDLVLNASYGTEATSMTLLEAMSLGIPAIATDYGGNPYVIADGVNGLLIPQKDSDAIAKAILTLKNDRNLYLQMSDNSRKVYYKRFTAKAMAAEINALYGEMNALDR